MMQRYFLYREITFGKHVLVKTWKHVLVKKARLGNTCWKRLQDILKTSSALHFFVFQDAFKTCWKTRNVCSGLFRKFLFFIIVTLEKRKNQCSLFLGVFRILSVIFSLFTRIVTDWQMIIKVLNTSALLALQCPKYTK